ncbi:conjugal transfer protein MobB [Polluticaenibacter yanchengensis]|uniref:Conjugal transfer protein MobB n=1 Tax=Polluticaenibacter yanchengensis TaxID=3014562 RepID=A0ABT4UFY9_9BACT|nr:conjugal transfer protein MobB [Chitinophagaceae bacterium LY-5]
MIAKISKGENLFGAISYNQQKVDKENGKVLLTNKIAETSDNQYTTNHFIRHFQPYLAANIKTEKPVRHISLNPDPTDKVSDDNFRKMAEQYMREMGYANQPFLVFKHTDIERTHIHIVTTCVELSGKKIPDRFDHKRSMDICRKLEKEFRLKPATEQKSNKQDLIFKVVEFNKGNIKSQVASVIRYLPKHYQFQTIGSYNALLSLFNITAEKVTGEYEGRQKNGLVYFALNGQGEKVGKPFKSSLFGKEAGLQHLEGLFQMQKELFPKYPSKGALKQTIETALNISGSIKSFKEQLISQGINVVIRRNEDNRIYGVTFIDHQSKTVWNGSQLSKDLSANAINKRFNDITVTQQESNNEKAVYRNKEIERDHPENKPHELFEFLNGESKLDDGFMESFSFIPQNQGEDYEELDFARRMKKKNRRKKRD